MKAKNGTPGRLNLLGSHYPWDEWFSFEELVLIKGIHFLGRLDTMSIQVRRVAAARGFSASITISEVGDSLHVLLRKKEM